MTVKIPMYVGYFHVEENGEGYYAQPLLFTDDDQAEELILKAIESAPMYDFDLYQIANFDAVKGELSLCAKRLVKNFKKLPQTEPVVLNEVNENEETLIEESVAEEI